MLFLFPVYDCRLPVIGSHQLVTEIHYPIQLFECYELIFDFTKYLLLNAKSKAVILPASLYRKRGSKVGNFLKIIIGATFPPTAITFPSGLEAMRRFDEASERRVGRQILFVLVKTISSEQSYLEVSAIRIRREVEGC